MTKKLRFDINKTKKLRNLPKKHDKIKIYLLKKEKGWDAMKKIISLTLALLMLFSLVSISAKAREESLAPESALLLGGGSVKDGYITYTKMNDYFGFKDLDLTGKKSVTLLADNYFNDIGNGDTLVVKIDDPLKGKAIGHVVMSKNGTKAEYKTPLLETEGIHDLYFVSLYGEGRNGNVRIYEVSLSSEAYERDNQSMKVSDDVTYDLYSDTWAATDSFGRKVASYEEAGDVKKGNRQVGMMYWNWFVSDTAKRKATIITDVISKYPEARSDYYHTAWDLNSSYYWSEPALGFYSSFDYWVARKHAEMLALAGVDVIFFDYTNSGNNMIPTLEVIAEAFRDAKADGLKVPKISALATIIMPNTYSFKQPASLYMSCFVDNDFSDIWYYMDGKPLLFANTRKEYALEQMNKNDTYHRELVEEIHDFFTIRYGAVKRDAEPKENEWFWLEHFPQQLRNPDKTGAPEFMSVGCSLNTPSHGGTLSHGAASYEYNKGRSFSEVFGSDYTPEAARKAYFFREQAALALTAEPEFIFINGWNEQTAARNKDWYGLPNTFVDTFDDDNSRDFEPSRGALKDDYYNLLCDFIRKYKGVRPTPVASGMKTIDIKGDVSQWDNVGPLFLNAYQNYERDTYGYSLPGEGFTQRVYKTTVNNAIKSAKVSFDKDKFYFLVICEEDIKEHDNNFLNLLINADREYSTGWEGYDYAVNLMGKGILSAYKNGAFEKTGEISYNIKGNTMMVEISKALLDLETPVNFEFKWTDSVSGLNDFMNFYSDGSVAPYGRFNYVYTEVAETTLGERERGILFDTSIFKAGSEKMIVNGAKMDVYEKAKGITPIEMNGTLYIPEDTFNEAMGYGRTKTDYNAFYNVLRTYHFEMNDELTEVTNYMWTYSTLDTLVAKADGELKTLSNPIKAIDGIIYIPLSFIEECYGYEVMSLGDGVYTLSPEYTPVDTVKSVLSHFN